MLDLFDLLWRFMLAGTAGVLIELITNSITQWWRGGRHGFPRLGYVSPWMFPVYAIGVPTVSCAWIELEWDHSPARVITASYTAFWGLEILIGFLALRMGKRLWDYNGRWGSCLNGTISLHPRFWIQWPLCGWCVLYAHSFICVWHR